MANMVEAEPLTNSMAAITKAVPMMPEVMLTRTGVPNRSENTPKNRPKNVPSAAAMAWMRSVAIIHELP